MLGLLVTSLLSVATHDASMTWDEIAATARSCGTYVNPRRVATKRKSNAGKMKVDYFLAVQITPSATDGQRACVSASPPPPKLP